MATKLDNRDFLLQSQERVDRLYQEKARQEQIARIKAEREKQEAEKQAADEKK